MPLFPLGGKSPRRLGLREEEPTLQLWNLLVSHLLEEENHHWWDLLRGAGRL